MPTTGYSVVGYLLRAVDHLQDVAAGRVQPDAHTARLLDLAAEVGVVLDGIRNNQTKGA